MLGTAARLGGQGQGFARAKAVGVEDEEVHLESEHGGGGFDATRFLVQLRECRGGQFGVMYEPQIEIAPARVRHRARAADQVQASEGIARRGAAVEFERA